MTVVQGALMGVVQGLTEFLPISSSGHLALARHLLHAGESQDVGFEVAVHAGTFLAVLIFFWTRIYTIVTEFFSGEGTGRRWTVNIIVGTIPAGIIGLSMKDYIDNLFNNLGLIGAAWIFTAIILLVSERIAVSRLRAEELGWKRALIIGFAQAVAIIPGVSRSGSTIAGGLLVGLERKQAVDFSFILSLPVVAAAILLTLKDWETGAVQIGTPHLVGAVTSFFTGYIAIAVMLKVVAAQKMKWFAYYCFALGLVTIWHYAF